MPTFDVEGEVEHITVTVTDETREIEISGGTAREMLVDVEHG